MYSYKIYERELVNFGRGKFTCKQKFIRECKLRKTKWYTNRWWSEQDDGSYRLRRNNKFISGVKYVRDLSPDDAVVEELFVEML